MRAGLYSAPASSGTPRLGIQRKDVAGAGEPTCLQLPRELRDHIEAARLRGAVEGMRKGCFDRIVRR